MEDRWLTREELAERLSIPVKTLAQWAYLGKGPRYARFGKYARYRLSDVIAWESAQFVDSREVAAAG
ncbi:Helix-turn-helix domain [Mycobacteroides abscessus subsp. bolletii]|uniref:helix-turn-helix transcriptional regulator n=1 Tax=Mycobacteroides abscessus TaxID=36809 RepID=UPI00092872A8|nr:helix-turn-helix domain-containing protein [Mycobacteroides abscessus]SHX93500.1 Helix-turn-helix domain [Mycobacteroides abscessus subsp. bolletii]SKP82086.1 Helix-turn-helix domain [Mycobacteroides abscessus subsp. bolletii]SKP99835.1 Helix-turn-helix domain [Mycobacteroides abscessus subsp. bolletii]SKQ16173.1 Helix-turn-helix domain [Mycobacteroides abscessus subsp. bolletii]